MVYEIKSAYFGWETKSSNKTARSLNNNDLLLNEQTSWF